MVTKKHQSDDGCFVFLLVFAILQLGGLVGKAKCLYHFANVAIHKVFDGVQRQTNAVVGNTSLWEVVSADTFTAVACANLAFACCGVFGIGLSLVVVVQFGFKDVVRLFAVFDLATLVLASNNNACWQVCDTDGRLRLVYVLATSAT